MKSTSAALAAHLAGPVTTLATCWRITRTDGQGFYFTDHDQDIAFDGNTYRASSGTSRTAIANDASLSVDNLEVEGIFEHDAITEEDLRAGLFDQAEVHVFLINWADPAMGSLPMRRGWFGEVLLSGQGVFRTELRGMTQALQQRIGELYSPSCRADLGDPRCKVPMIPPLITRDTDYAEGAVVRVVVGDGEGSLAFANRHYRCIGAGTTAEQQPPYDPTPGSETSDGTALFRAEEAWTRSAEVTEIIDPSTLVITLSEPRAGDGWFTGGVVTWDSGANIGRSMEVTSWAENGLLTLFLPMPQTVAVGDRLAIHPGCDKRLDTCIQRFDNVLNFRGEPYVPGPDTLMRYPDAR